ncbi:MAG TPA: DinB family protein [bacterium]|nr:DinB family protein [bacterium]
MTTPWIEVLRNATVGAFQGPNGDYPSVLDVLDGLTAVQASWKQSLYRHSIWQIVDHLAKSKEWERRVILGERPPAPTWEDPGGDDAAWLAAIVRLRGAQGQLLETIDRLAEDELWKRPPTQTGWPVVNLVLNKAAHDAYHAGQIRHLRALQENLNDEMVTRLVRQRAMPTGPIEATVRAVRREHFLPGVALEAVYSGEAVITRRGPEGIPISSSSMPEIMALMLQQLDVQPGHRVLEVGAGTGYNAALLGVLAGPAGDVTTVDIDAAIVQEARQRLDASGHPVVRTVTADGWLGVPEYAPFDRIEVTVGVSDLSPAWVTQLKDGGRLVVPLWLARGQEVAVAFHNRAGCLRSVAVILCGFMRLRGPHAGPETFVTVRDWFIPLEEPDPVRLAALETVLACEPRVEPAPPGLQGWWARLLLEEPRAITLGRKGEWRKNGCGILEVGERPGLAFVTARTWDHQLYTFGSDAARAMLLERLVGIRPLDVRDLTIEAIAATAPQPQDGMVLRRRNFQFVLRERGATDRQGCFTI